MRTLIKLFKLIHLPHLLFIGLICIGIVRISSTYGIFWQTFDEPYYIARGMEWLDQEHYSKKKDGWHNEATPLPGIMAAMRPYYKGLRATGITQRSREGNNILHSDNNYEANLTFSRIPIVFFFVIATWVVWLWSNWLFSEFSGLLSVFLFTTQPIILANSGLATSDMVAATTFLLALFALNLWLEKPSLQYSCILGMLMGLSFLAKYSNIVYFCASGAINASLYLCKALRTENNNIPMKLWIIRSGIILLICSLIIWAGYRFSITFLASPNTRPHLTIDRIFGADGVLHQIAYFIVERIPIPAPDFWLGFQDVAHHNSVGHLAYLLGDVYMRGRWYFYPISVAVKTTLPFLLLTILGISLCFKEFLKRPQYLKILVPSVGVMGVLTVAMASNLNLGIRHVLQIYPLSAILAGYGASSLWRSNKSRFLGSVLLIIIIAWQVKSSVLHTQTI